MKAYPACKITFFEIPPYSIIDFNSHRKHGDPASVKKQEKELLKTIQEVNGYIRQQNQSLHTFSPQFATDITHHHNEKASKSKKITLRDNYQFDLYFDGIHPTIDLARVWLKKIALQIQKDFWG